MRRLGRHLGARLSRPIAIPLWLFTLMVIAILINGTRLLHA